MPSPFSIAPGTEGYFYVAYMKLFETNVPCGVFRHRVLGLISDIRRSCWNPEVLPEHLYLTLNLAATPTYFQLYRIVHTCQCTMCPLYAFIQDL